MRRAAEGQVEEIREVEARGTYVHLIRKEISEPRARAALGFDWILGG